jgi:glycine/serine hydroxymethyltransferase
MKEAEMLRVGDWIADVLEEPDDADLQARVREQVVELCRGFPLPYSPLA